MRQKLPLALRLFALVRLFVSALLEFVVSEIAFKLAGIVAVKVGIFVDLVHLLRRVERLHLETAADEAALAQAFGVHSDVAAEGLDDLLHDGESKSNSFLVHFR